jgi:glycerophosphoryl diester phosphodiesterase
MVVPVAAAVAVAVATKRCCCCCCCLLQVAAVHHGLLDAQLVSALRSGGKSPYAWTADAPAELQRLLDLGVDGIVTNKPELLSAAIDQRLSKCSAAAQHKH